MIPNQDWQAEDYDLEDEFSAEIISLRAQRKDLEVPKQLDRKIARIARHSIADSLQTSWLLSQSARLTLVILLFFAIGIAYVLSLP